MGARTSRFTYCVELLVFLAASTLWAQATTPPGWPTATPQPTGTPTQTFTPNPFSTPTWTPTWDPWSTDTFTPTPNLTNAPSNTPTQTFTPTVTGTIPTSTPTMTSTPSISRASLALWPTAYSNAWDRWDGFNWDIGFTYFIGTIAEKDVSSPSVDYLNPLRLWLLTSDVKYAWLDEDGDTPAFASGVLLSMLLNGGNPGASTAANSSSASSGSNSFQLTGSTVGGIYTVMSKSVDKGSAVHFGYIYGFNQAMQSIGLGDFAPSMNYSQLLPLTTLKLADIAGEDPPNIFYTGYNTRLLGTNWKFEIWKPFPMDENPVLFDSQIDGLFAFNLGYERWDHGYAILGYFNFRFTIIPVSPDY